MRRVPDEEKNSFQRFKQSAEDAQVAVENMNGQLMGINRQMRRLGKQRQVMQKGVAKRKDGYIFTCRECDLILREMPYEAANAFARAHHKIHDREREQQEALERLIAEATGWPQPSPQILYGARGGVKGTHPIIGGTYA
jgi:hypothetical protein